jgi:hypothetical protein
MRCLPTKELKRKKMLRHSITFIMLEMSPIVSDVLHLGCDRKKEPGSFGVDLVNSPEVDLVHD